MRTWMWTTMLAVAVGGLVYANASTKTAGFVCPITGETLPCAICCPLNKEKKEAATEGYTCPVTGEQLPCEKCCPLNQGK